MPGCGIRVINYEFLNIGVFLDALLDAAPLQLLHGVSRIIGIHLRSAHSETRGSR